MFNKFICGAIVAVSMVSLNVNAEKETVTIDCPKATKGLVEFQADSMDMSVVLDKKAQGEGWSHATKKQEVDGPFTLKPELKLYHITVHRHDEGDSLWC